MRNSWVVRANGEATPFYDAADFEQAKRRAGGIEAWIEEQLKGTSVKRAVLGFRQRTFRTSLMSHDRLFLTRVIRA